MPSSRLSLRLGQLPHDVLADLAARLCSDSPALQAIAEECMAAHKPLSHELVERVLLSPDLVPFILGPLEAKDGAAAAVCSQWLVGWKATNETPWRRRLKQVPLDFPEELLLDDDGDGLFWTAATPDGRLALASRYGVHILDRSMRVLQTVACENGGLIATSDDSIFHAHGQTLHRTSHDGTAQAEHQLVGYNFDAPLLAPGGLLFCVIWNDGEGDQDEIVALDAQTLQLRHRFGLGLLNEAHQLAAVGEELYVCDMYNDRLQVFSLAGEHRRSITGAWRRPERVCFAKDRLYLVEFEDDSGEAYESQRRGKRILVLSLQGDVLQVVTNPTEPTAEFTSICCYEDTLLACWTARQGTPGTHMDTKFSHGMLALRGL
jgi:hypothetical protein